MPEDEDEPPPVVRAEQSTVVTEQTTLVPNEAEAFALEPLDITTMGKLTRIYWLKSSYSHTLFNISVALWMFFIFRDGKESEEKEKINCR